MTAAEAVTALLLVWAALVAVVDWRQRRIPNLLLLALLLPAAVWLPWQGRGLAGADAWQSLAGMGIAFALTLPGYAMSRLGAGDVKLASVMGFVQGVPELLYTLLAAALLLGAMSLVAVRMAGFANARLMRLPAGVALSAGFAGVLGWGWFSAAGGWR